MTAIAHDRPDHRPRPRPARRLLTTLRRSLRRRCATRDCRSHVAGPLVMLLLFVYVFGEALGAVAGGGTPEPEDVPTYVDYAPGTPAHHRRPGERRPGAVSAAAMDMPRAASWPGSGRWRSRPCPVLSGPRARRAVQAPDRARARARAPRLRSATGRGSTRLDWLAVFGLLVLRSARPSTGCRVAMGLGRVTDVETASNHR